MDVVLTLGPRALVPDSVAPNDQGTHSYSMLEDSVELSGAVGWERALVGMLAGPPAVLTLAGGARSACKDDVGDTVVGIAADIAADRLDFHILVDVGNAAAIVRP